MIVDIGTWEPEEELYGAQTQSCTARTLFEGLTPLTGHNIMVLILPTASCLVAATLKGTRDQLGRFRPSFLLQLSCVSLSPPIGRAYHVGSWQSRNVVLVSLWISQKAGLKQRRYANDWHCISLFPLTSNNITQRSIIRVRNSLKKHTELYIICSRGM